MSEDEDCRKRVGDRFQRFERRFKRAPVAYFVAGVCFLALWVALVGYLKRSRLSSETGSGAPPWTRGR